jgi:hypothetical protein
MEMSIDKENIDKLSDEELRSTLKQCGINPGPIMASTRKVYEKKLKNFLETGNTTIINTTLNNTAVSNATLVNTTASNTSKSTRSGQKNAAAAATEVNSSQPFAPIENFNTVTSTQRGLNHNNHNEQISVVEASAIHNEIRASAKTASPRGKVSVNKSVSREQVASQEIAPSQNRPALSVSDTAVAAANSRAVVRLERLEEPVQQQRQQQTIKQINNPFKKTAELPVDEILSTQQPLQPLAHNNKQFSSNLFNDNANVGHLNSYIPVRARSAMSSSQQQTSNNNNNEQQQKQIPSPIYASSSNTNLNTVGHESRSQQQPQQQVRQQTVVGNVSGFNSSPSKAVLTSSVNAYSQYRGASTGTNIPPKPDIQTVSYIFSLKLSFFAQI